MKLSVNDIKLPFAAIKTCPACKSDNNLRVRVLDVVCACGWDSSAAFVDSGAMDVLIAEWERLEEQRLKASLRKARPGSGCRTVSLVAG
jgi:hypothetical protein